MIAIIGFYNRAFGAQSRLSFSDDFQHCNIVMFDGADYVLTEFGSGGIENRVLKVTSLPRFLSALKNISYMTNLLVLWIDPRMTWGWSPFLIRSCNEICRYTAGLDIGRTYNPRHLYKKLLRLNGERNYRIDYRWSRKNG